MQEDILEAFKCNMLFFYLSILLTFCIVSGAELGDRVELEFQAHRIQQFEVPGTSNILGSKSFKLLYDAVSIEGTALRKCTVASWRDLATRDLSNLLSTSLGALVIVLPEDYSSLSPTDRKLLLDLESYLLNVQTDLSVYAIPASESANALLSQVSAGTSPLSSSAAATLINSFVANTFQISSSATATSSKISYTPKNVIARLAGSNPNANTIAFFAHYDSHSIFPGLAIGSDSNGSGVVALLELVSLLKKFYENPSTRPNQHMVFVWTAAGRQNYQGTRAFVEEMQEKFPDDKLELAICIDSIGKGRKLYTHVSKQPSVGSTVDKFVSHLRSAAKNSSVEVIAKKISLSQAQLSWEHERLNIKRLPGITISAIESPNDVVRRSLSDNNIDVDILTYNIRSIAEAIISLTLQLPQHTSSDERVSADSSILSSESVSRERVALLTSSLTSFSRSVSNQVATEKIVSNIYAYAQNYAKVRTLAVQLETTVTVDVPERIVAEMTKPALFDLALAAFIFVYLAAFVRLSLISQSALDSSVVAVRKAL